MRQIRNIVRYVVLFLLNLYVMLAFHSYLNLIFLVVLLAAPIVSLLAVWVLSLGFQISFGLPKEALTAGEEFCLCFQIENPYHIPLVNAYVRVKLSNPFYGSEGVHTWNLPVRAGRRTKLSYPLVMEHCGRVVIRADEVVFMDLLGLFRWKKKLDAKSECLILPHGNLRAQEMERTGLHGESEPAGNEKGYDFSEVSDIREYRPGDLLKDIHWKLSVKKDELMVKERIGLADQRLNVVLELGGDDSFRLDAVLTLADGITRALVQEKLLFTLFYYSTAQDKICEFPISDEAGRRQWLKLLMYDRADSRSRYIRNIFENEHPGSAYLYIGYDDGNAKEPVIYGEQRTAAVLVEG